MHGRRLSLAEVVARLTYLASHPALAAQFGAAELLEHIAALDELLGKPALT